MKQRAAMRPNQAKALGQLMLLVAFFGQWWFLDKIRDEENDRLRVDTIYSDNVTHTDLLHLRYLIDKNMYALQQAADHEKSALLRMIGNLPELSSEYAIIRRALEECQPKIETLADYSAFRSFASDQDFHMQKIFHTRGEKLDRYKVISWWVVFAVTIGGLGALAYGELRDDKLSR